MAYVIYLLFGTQSVSTLLSLEERRDQIKLDAERLKEQNAKLQKEYFELKSLQGKEP